jgi:hypothetical protein
LHDDPPDPTAPTHGQSRSRPDNTPQAGPQQGAQAALHRPQQPSRRGCTRVPFLLADGVGDPTAASYRAAARALYGVAHSIRFAVKNGDDAVEYPVMPLQGQWLAPDGREVIATGRRSWRWTMMILQSPPSQRGADGTGRHQRCAAPGRPRRWMPCACSGWLRCGARRCSIPVPTVRRPRRTTAYTPSSGPRAGLLLMLSRACGDCVDTVRCRSCWSLLHPWIVRGSAYIGGQR